MSPRSVTRLVSDSDRASRLAEDHRVFDEVFEDLLARARGGDWHDLDDVWDKLVRDLEEHLEFEEDVVFPAFAERGRDCRVLVAALIDVHAQIRAELADLGIQIQTHEIRASAVEKLVALLRGHAALENERIYPWAKAEARRWGPRDARQGAA